jgi:hypothetical protein
MHLMLVHHPGLVNGFLQQSLLIKYVIDNRIGTTVHGLLIAAIFCFVLHSIRESAVFSGSVNGFRRNIQALTGSREGHISYPGFRSSAHA